MKRVFLSLVLAAVFGACGSDSPSRTTPTSPTPTPAPAPAPTPILPANFTYGSGTLDCIRGFCFSFTTALTNTGPGCATNIRARVVWYGSDGAILLPNTPIIEMGYPGGLSNVFFRPGTAIVISSLGGFNDVRSAHTVYRTFVDWNDARC
jgi:hypothetical protein